MYTQHQWLECSQMDLVIDQFALLLCVCVCVCVCVLTGCMDVRGRIFG